MNLILLSAAVYVCNNAKAACVWMQKKEIHQTTSLKTNQFLKWTPTHIAQHVNDEDGDGAKLA